MKISAKQTRALDLLEHDRTKTEILYGGGAGGGKSILGTYWILKSALKYPRTRWLIGRKEMKTLRETTQVSLLKVMRMQGVTPAHYKYNDVKGTYEFPNGAQILLKGLPYEPSDTDYDYLGSLELTGAFVDEISQVRQKAWQVLKSRIRHELDEYGLAPKLLGSCNPSKAWPYRYFYKPAIDKTLEDYKAYIPALVTDNPFITQHYTANLRTLDAASRERLLLGNWEYNDDPTTLIRFDAIASMFTNAFPALATGGRYITVDVARFGDDTTRINVWYGWRREVGVRLVKKSTKDVAAEVLRLARLHMVPLHQVLVDEDGVGGGVLDQLPGAKGFQNGSRALPNPAESNPERRGLPENYENVKTQCSYRIAERINNAGVHVANATPDEMESLTEECEQIKRRDADQEGKMRLQPKDYIKEAIGRSPDCWDALMMREWFELSQPRFMGRNN